ncbi:hypothetical protein IT575_09090 [bacterium]|nr:hypothetical protein [bacterium]
MDSVVVYISLGVACASLAVAVTAIVLLLRGGHKVPVTSKLRREIRVGWQQLLPHVSVDTEHLLLRGESAHNNRAALLASLGVDVEVAEGEGINRDEIAYLALISSTLMVRSSRDNTALTDNFLEHRLLRRLFEARKLRRAWRFARKLAPPENREQIDEYLRNNYPRESWMIGLDADEHAAEHAGGEVTWGKGVVLMPQDLDEAGDDELDDELLAAAASRIEEARAAGDSSISSQELLGELLEAPQESREQIIERSMAQADMSLRAEAEEHVASARKVLSELQAIARSRGSETVKAGAKKGEVPSKDHKAAPSKPGPGRTESADGPQDQAS